VLTTPTVTIDIPATIPPTGTIRRCPHAVYWPEGDDFAFHCGMCNPTLYLGVTKRTKIVFPRSAKALDHDRLFANAKDKSACPRCRSYVHIVESDTHWRCADCDTLYPHVTAERKPGEYVSDYDNAAKQRAVTA
jgi:hypothetical protein